MNVVGEPLHVPLLVVSVLPSWAVPEIVGGDWFAGGACGAAPPVSARPATAASRSSAPTAASPSTFSSFACLSFPRMHASRSFSPPGGRRNRIRSGFTGRLHLRLHSAAERHGPGGPAGLQNRPGRATHGLLGSTPGPLRCSSAALGSRRAKPGSAERSRRWRRSTRASVLSHCPLALRTTSDEPRSNGAVASSS